MGEYTFKIYDSRTGKYRRYGTRAEAERFNNKQAERGHIIIPIRRRQ